MVPSKRLILGLATALWILPSLTFAQLASEPSQRSPLDPLTKEERQRAERAARADARVLELLGSGRQRLISVEFLAVKPEDPAQTQQTQDRRIEIGRHAVVLLYRYDGDFGVRSVVDLQQGVVLQAARVRGDEVPISEEEIREAARLALQNREVRGILGPAAERYVVEGLREFPSDEADPCAQHRCLALQFRLGNLNLAATRVVVDLTTQTVSVGPLPEPPEPFPEIPIPRRPERPFRPPVVVPRPLPVWSCSWPYFVEQRFPTVGSEVSRWRVCWQAQPKHGLVITSAHFRKSPASPWVRVFWDARVSEIFVPYHGNEARFRDISQFNFQLHVLAGGDCPSAKGGTLLGSPSQVCKEVHDRGLLWKEHDSVRRGEQLVLWGALHAVNYDYVMAWVFRDDGVVEGRVGATAVNYPRWPTVAHLHNPIWRLDIDLDGFPGDSVHQGLHNEPLPGLTATDSAPLIGAETGLAWEHLKFHALHVHDASLRNDKGHPTSYHLIPLRSGTPRHQEGFTKNDFWVTRYSSAELLAADTYLSGDLPQYVSNQENVSNADVIVWYMGSMHHIPRDEDGECLHPAGGSLVRVPDQQCDHRTPGPPPVFWRGTALISYTGFVLMPHNFFDRTPFYP